MTPRRIGWFLSLQDVLLTTTAHIASNTISFIPLIVSTSGCLHCEIVCLLFSQDHRETDRFFQFQEFILLIEYWWVTGSLCRSRVVWQRDPLRHYARPALHQVRAVSSFSLMPLVSAVCFSSAAFGTCVLGVPSGFCRIVYVIHTFLGRKGWEKEKANGQNFSRQDCIWKFGYHEIFCSFVSEEIPQ